VILPPLAFPGHLNDFFVLETVWQLFENLGIFFPELLVTLSPLAFF
jgi:hypothetical protein